MHRVPQIQSTLSLLAIGLLVLAAVQFSAGSSSVVPMKARASCPTTTTWSDSTLPSAHRTGPQSKLPFSSRPTGRARRLVSASSPRRKNVSLAIVHAGTETVRIVRQDVMAGHAVRASRPIGSVRPGRELSIELGDWPSGLYFARLTAAGGRVGYAPFVLEPRKLGEHRDRRRVVDDDLAGLQLPRR